MGIRHSEKPGVSNKDSGVMANGSADDERSAIRACHTAGASIAFGLCTPEMRRGAIFA